MKTRRTLLLSILLILSSVMMGQTWDRAPISLQWMGKTYNKAILTYKNGETKMGYVAIPKKCKQGTISFRSNKDSKTIKLKSQNLGSIRVLNKDSSVYVFERVNFVINPDDKPRKIGWLYVMQEGYATLYFKIDRYKIDKKGMLNFIAYEGLPMIFLKNKGERKAVLISIFNPYLGLKTVIGANRYFKKNAPILFSEDKELVDKITKGQYDHLDVEEVVEIYNKFMAGK